MSTSSLILTTTGCGVSSLWARRTSDLATVPLLQASRCGEKCSLQAAERRGDITRHPVRIWIEKAPERQTTCFISGQRKELLFEFTNCQMIFEGEVNEV